MIDVDHLTKKYGSFTAVNDISFQVNKGEILGFLGPNGAGKTTTMKMLSCFITPNSGTARIGGHDILSESIAVRKMIGYLPENAPSYQNMTVIEFLDFIAAARGFDKKDKKSRVEQIMELTSLKSAKFQTIDTLSKGYRQRVGFAQALIHDPPVLILDEPTDGLDPNQKLEVRALIKKMAQEKAIILSTHILEEMEAVCTRAVIISQGKIVADGSPEVLLTNSRLYNVVFCNFDTAVEESAFADLAKQDPIEKLELRKDENDQSQVLFFPKNRADILPLVNGYLAEKQIKPLEIYREKGSMDEVFRNLTLGGNS